MRTSRLEPRPFALSDAPAIHAVYSDSEVMEHVGNGPVGDLEETEAMLRDYIAHQEAHGFSFWAVIERDSGELNGDAGLYLLDGRGPEIELGYTLGRSWWGRGYTTEAARSPTSRTQPQRASSRRRGWSGRGRGRPMVARTPSIA